MYDYRGNSIDQFFAGLDTSSFSLWRHTFAYCTNITTIPLIDTSSATDMSNMFYYAGITTIPLLNTTKVTTLSRMFESCKNLTEVPLLDTSKGPIMSYMFTGCKSLQSVPLFNTSNTKDLSYMFNQCTNLTSVPLFDLSSATSITSMFNGCTSLKTIEMNSWEKVTSSYSAGAMCVGCSQLEKFIIRNATKAPLIAASGTSYNAMFKDCYHFNGTFDPEINVRGKKDGRIYIADELVDTLKAATHWSYYADCIYPLSEYSEGEEESTQADLLRFEKLGSYNFEYKTVADEYYRSGPGVTVKVWFRVPEGATNRTLRIRYANNASYEYKYLIATSHIDSTDTTEANAYYYAHQMTLNGEIVYENLPTGDHFIKLQDSHGSSFNVYFNFDFVE